MFTNASWHDNKRMNRSAAAVHHRINKPQWSHAVILDVIHLWSNMPVDKETRKTVNKYVFKHVVPKNVRPRPDVQIKWFADLFAFIDKTSLRRHLGEALYQGRFLGRLQEALDLTGGINSLFLKQQIVLYASIYEAVIDHFLEKHSDNEDTSHLFTTTELKKQTGALSKNSKMTYTVGEKEFEIIPCSEFPKSRKLRDIRFDTRVDAANRIGLLPDFQVDFVKSLYKNRNNIHIRRAVSSQFEPDSDESSLAFKQISRFVNHAKRWVEKNKVSG